ncbi:MAG: HD domain-containing phosphohydrolase [Solidesulfovibrio sp. DCME]|uniref:HD domain-containing phosphohydrolase n=1 Tax=Solidesulfovibrio sp. DCME TaxID=3447380 RepID=UPI003D151C59
MTRAVTSPESSRVLVVEDEAVVGMDIRHRLTRLGHAVVAVVDSGEEAVRMVAATAPDVVLMDIMLKGNMDGVEAAGRIRGQGGPPVVFLTAHSDAQTLRRAGEVGPYGYVIKPFDDRELGAALDIALSKSRMERRLAENERWMGMTLANLEEGVLTVDPAGLVRFANSAALRLLGEEAADLVGRELAAVYRTRAVLCPDVADAAADKRERCVVLCCRGGAHLPIEQTLSPLVDDRGKTLGTVVVFRDISRRRSTEQALRRSLANLRRTMEETVNALTVTSETRDPFTAGHQQRVSRLAHALTVELGFEAEEREAVRVAGLVHDIGKIHVPSEILAKPEVLTPIEMGIVRDHSQVGYDILRDIPFPWPVARMVLEHHERLDGSGYPRGLRGGEQLVGARVLAVADVVEAMTAHRPYRAALPLDAALDEIGKGRGLRYDPDVVDACLLLFERGGFRF